MTNFRNLKPYFSNKPIVAKKMTKEEREKSHREVMKILHVARLYEKEIAKNRTF
jgi:hypothetical protein